MNIPPYWARARYTVAEGNGKGMTFAASGWSFRSREEAETEARRRAQRAAALVAAGQARRGYDYLDRPMREEIVETVDPGGGEPLLITRNRYGARVLNSPNVLFADVDCPPATPAGAAETLLWLFLPARRRQRQQALWDDRLLRVRRWAEANPAHPFRLYRTHAGLRLLFIGRTYRPASDEVSRILVELDADPLYRRLTERQQCFRARLTPKPWRCGLARPPRAYPWESAADEAAARSWETTYENTCRAYGTCRLVATYGAAARDAAVTRTVERHDVEACAPEDRPLA